ncbi:MAG TPA: hypothetical protein P5526_03110 [Anaerolineae bacterium]|nr:hypothetical protein [Anaerolineae bacterium]
MTNIAIKPIIEVFPHLDQLSNIKIQEEQNYRNPNSPLGMITQEPLLNELVTQLQQLRIRLMDTPDAFHQICFSKSELDKVRSDFAKMILRGEKGLHQLSHLICNSFVNSYQLRSVIFGEVDKSKGRFTLTLDITPDELYSTPDIDLGTRQLNRLLFNVGSPEKEVWSGASLVANTIDYLPTEPNEYKIHRIISRIKAEEEIWNKVVDEIFDLDSIVVRDKKLRHFSRFVKDIFGVKIVVGEDEDVYRVQHALSGLRWSDETLKAVGALPDPSTRTLEFVEVKDYLGRQRKQSGWEAVKSVVRWGDKTFEIQVQPLRNFLRERELLTRESHTSFKAKRERVREQVAQQIPLFHFYRELLRWLFLSPDTPPPQYHQIHLQLVD